MDMVTFWICNMQFKHSVLGLWLERRRYLPTSAAISKVMPVWHFATIIRHVLKVDTFRVNTWQRKSTKHHQGRKIHQPNMSRSNIWERQRPSWMHNPSFIPYLLWRHSLGSTAFIADDDDDVLLVVSFLPPSLQCSGLCRTFFQSLSSIYHSLSHGWSLLLLNLTVRLNSAYTVRRWIRKKRNATVVHLFLTGKI